MKPVVIFRHACCEGAGYLGTFLAQHAIPWCEVRIDKGEPVPASVAAYSGIVLMGGPMSVNDDLPWIPPLLGLIREAVQQDVPLLGHCLGGQLISKALGGTVRQNRVKEIGWGEVSVLDNSHARQWFGDLQSFNSFHWHGETFTIPDGATQILASPYCENQAYVLGKHIGFQCHIEMMPEMVKVWTENWKADIANSASSPAVQSASHMLANLEHDCERLHAVADRVYARWITGL
ncbi:type 1 glutamine amidotransferase [Methylophilus aquaticus]|uniref:Type 1 glutamine amidotransferase n=1 Tax=Methylophilus aquaticus TaxID=1971610 RepID=A0ABT9JSG0_9PROT|nr:type 1 glutamine amidotransferase [Methylophilus aquaticus]MDP8567526.1 type 1 glutamine amidotransferase [Methylophilus aquaticus]